MRFQTDLTMKIRDAIAGRHEPEAARVLGEAFWMILVATMLFLTLSSIALGLYEFFRPMPQGAETPASASRKTVTKAELVEILEALDARATEYEARRTAPIPVRDPS